MTLDELKKNKPTIQWIGDERFTEKKINAVNEILDDYILNLEKLGSEPAKKRIKYLINVTFSRINELNSYFIDTFKKEELSAFIYKAAQIAGLKGMTDVKIKRITKKKRKGNVGIGMAVGLIVWVTVLLVYDLIHNTYGFIFLGQIIGMILTIGFSVYFFVKGTIYTAIGLIIFFVIDVFIYFFLFYAVAMAGFPSL